MQLDIDRNQITSIDLSKNIWLEELYCAGNGLTKLDVSTIQALEMIQCYNNKISGQNMDNLIGSLPLNDTPTYFDNGGYLPNKEHCLMIGGKLQDITRDDAIQFARDTRTDYQWPHRFQYSYRTGTGKKA